MSDGARWSVVAVVFAAMLSVTGCESSAAEIWCDAFCVTKGRCFPTRNINCSDECVRTRPGLANLSADGAHALAPCIAKLTCEVFSNDEQWQLQTDACWTAAVDVVHVRASVRPTCAPYSQAWFECGYSDSTDLCERNLSMWTDEVANRLKPCAESATCAELQACSSATWDDL